ncbi:MAG: anti-CBASS protein Acb1 family protein [Leptolyngbyaceae cyanobacterium]
MRKVVYTLPKAACRKWGTVTLDGGDPQDIEELNRALLRIPVIDTKRQRRGGGFKSAISLALGLAFKTGNGAIILDADDGRPLYEPLDLKNFRKIKSLRVASRWHITPYFYNSQGGSYSHYQIFGQGLYSPGDEFSSPGTVIHRSRVFWFSGIEEDDEFLGNRYNSPGTDRSILDLVIDAFLEYYGGIKGAGRMIADFDVIVHYIKGLAEMVQADCDGATNNAQSLVAQTAARNAKSRSAFREYLADADEEKLEHVTRQVGGYNDLLNTLKTYLQANTPYPPAVLFGEFSSGLTASGEGQEERALWNETISELQEDKITPNLISLDPEFVGILGVVMAQREGPTKGEILDNVGWQWKPLYDPTPQQQAALEKDRATIIQTLAALDPRFTPNAILSNYGGQEYQPVVTLTDEYKAALEAEARLEKESPTGEDEEIPKDDDETTVLNEADGGTEDDVDLTEFAEFIDFDEERSDSTEEWETTELFPRLDARKSKLKVGDTKSKNGKTYVFNDNRRWALKREGGSKPKAKSKRKTAAKGSKKGPQPGDTKVSKSGKTMVFNGDTRRWRLQRPEDVKQAKAELKKAVEKKGAKLTPSEARGVIEEIGVGLANPKEKTQTKTESKNANDPSKDPSVGVNRKVLDAKRQRLVDSVGVNLVEKAEANMQKLMDAADLAIRVPSSNVLEKIIGDRFRTQFETNTSKALKNKTARKVTEREAFGYDEKTDKALRPIYGYLSGSKSLDSESDGDLDGYGTIAVRMKSAVRDKATFTGDDSLATENREVEDEDVIPSSSLRNVNAASMLRERNFGVLEDPEETLDIIANAESFEELRQVGGQYLEVQYHGQLKPSDIGEIVFTSEKQKPSPKIKEWAKQNGVNIIEDYSREKNAAAKEKEENESLFGLDSIWS